MSVTQLVSSVDRRIQRCQQDAGHEAGENEPETIFAQRRVEVLLVGGVGRHRRQFNALVHCRSARERLE